MASWGEYFLKVAYAFNIRYHKTQFLINYSIFIIRLVKRL